MAKTAAVATIPNAGAMSEFIGAFDVPSKVTDYVYKCRFSHCWNGIATRHSDTMDCKFFVDGKGVVLGLAHPGFVAFRDRAGRNPSDREASYIAAEYLRKGSQVFVEGKLRTRKWQDTEGHDRYSTEIHLTPYNGVLTFLDSRRDGERPAGGEPAGSTGPGGDPDGEIPF